MAGKSSLEIPGFSYPARSMPESAYTRAEIAVQGRLIHPDDEFYDVPHLEFRPGFSIRFAERDPRRPITEVRTKEGIVIVSFMNPQVTLDDKALRLSSMPINRRLSEIQEVVIKPGSVAFRSSDR